VQARRSVFLGTAALSLSLNLLLPPLVLSVARKPWDYFTVNPWLGALPSYLVTGDVPLRQKVAFLPNLVLFWFSSDNAWGVEWGVAVSVADVLRFLATAVLLAAYLALWVEGRHRVGLAGWPARAGRPGGVAAALASVVGFSTGPCSVMGCGAPVMPVVGLAVAGLSSGTIQFLSRLSTVATGAMFLTLLVGVGYFGNLVDRAARGPRRGSGEADRGPR
jgi:hypothetical protein